MQRAEDTRPMDEETRTNFTAVPRDQLPLHKVQEAGKGKGLLVGEPVRPKRKFTAQTLRGLKEVKRNTTAGSGSKKYWPMQIDLNPDGFFDVRVEYGHCEDLAETCGVRTDEVVHIIQEDNMARRNRPNQHIRFSNEKEIGDDMGMEEQDSRSGVGPKGGRRTN